MTARTKKKPPKPRRDFPLYAHRNGQWAKKVNSKVYYFGPWDDPTAAERRWDEQKEDLRAGRQPRADSPDGTTVADLVNHFLTSKDLAVEAKELSPRQFQDLKRAGVRVADHFGRNRAVSDLRPDDFRVLKAQMVKRYKSPSSLQREITNVRSIFKYGWENEYCDIVNFGTDFKPPSIKQIKKYKQHQKRTHGGRDLTVEQLHALLESTHRVPALRAMILMAVNTGCNNSDLSGLQFSDVDLESGWLEYARAKTGEVRRAKLWTETTEAIELYLQKRKQPVDPVYAELIFTTRYGQPWGRPDSRINQISRAFREELNSLEIYRTGLSFVSLRHTFRTVADGCLDQAAVNFAMGHADNSMAGKYRQRIADERLEAVATYVHKWLWP